MTGGKCPTANGLPPSDGSGQIDVRIVSVSYVSKALAYLIKLCLQTATGTTTGSIAAITSIASSGITPSMIKFLKA